MTTPKHRIYMPPGAYKTQRILAPTMPQGGVGLWSSRGANLLTDGDMEAAGVGDWVVGGTTITKQTSDPFEGTRYMRSVNTGTNGNFRQVVMDGSSEYRVTGAARSLEGVARPRIFVGTWIWYGTTSTVWQEFDVAFTSSNATIYLYTRDGIAGQGTEWDELYLSLES